MKTSRSIFLGGLVIIAAAVSVGYSAHTTTRLRELERRVQHAEALLQLQSQSLADNTTAARIGNLGQRVQSAELAASQAQLGGSGGTAGLEQRIQNVEQKIKPHLEALPHDPYK